MSDEVFDPDNYGDKSIKRSSKIAIWDATVLGNNEVKIEL